MTDREKDKAFIDALLNFNKACEMYKLIFGASSLDRVFVISPGDIATEELNDSIKMLASAIANNEPLEQFDEDMWEHVKY